MSDVTVLLSSAGRRVILLEQLRDGARLAGLSARIVTTDCSPLTAAGRMADHLELVPRLDDETYMDALLGLVRRESIDLIVPTIDTELPLLAEHRDRLNAAGAEVLVSSRELIDICADKSRSSQWLAGAGFPVPRQYALDELTAINNLNWPLFFKPVQGSSSVGAMPVHSIEDVKSAIDRYGDGVVEELIVGDEFTVDCWVDPTGACATAVPRQRLAIRAGEVAKGMTVTEGPMEALCRDVVEALPGARGPLSVQLIRSEHGYRIIEVNPRFGGGYPLTHASGATYTAALMAETVGKPVDPEWFAWRPDLVMLRYDDAVFATAEEVGLATP